VFFDTGIIVHSTAGQTTWAVPAGVTKIRVHLVGGGGGGHDYNDFRNAGGGGGIVVGELVVTPEEVLYIQVGTGGVGRTTNADSGGGTGSYIKRSSHSGSFLAAAGGGGGGRRNSNGNGNGGGQAFGTSINGGNGTTGSAGSSGNNYIRKLSAAMSYIGVANASNSMGVHPGMCAREFTALYNSGTHYGFGGSTTGGNGINGAVVIEW
jgi:hypothetical protein